MFSHRERVVHKVYIDGVGSSAIKPGRHKKVNDYNVHRDISPCVKTIVLMRLIDSPTHVQDVNKCGTSFPWPVAECHHMNCDRASAYHSSEHRTLRHFWKFWPHLVTSGMHQNVS